MGGHNEQILQKCHVDVYIWSSLDFLQKYLHLKDGWWYYFIDVSYLEKNVKRWGESNMTVAIIYSKNLLKYQTSKFVAILNIGLVSIHKWYRQICFQHYQLVTSFLSSGLFWACCWLVIWTLTCLFWTSLTPIFSPPNSFHIFWNSGSFSTSSLSSGNYI